MWLLKKLHTYAGLLTFINLAVYGIVGLSIFWLRQPGGSAPVVSYQDFAVGPNLTDRQVAEQICAQLHLWLATPIQNFAIQRDSANNLLLDFRHANGRDRVTVLEPERRIRIETTRKNLAGYLYTLHETTGVFHSGDWRMQLWADYNEFAMWSLAAMIVTGFAMFLASRWGSALAQISLVAGCVLFAALYYWTR